MKEADSLYTQTEEYSKALQLFQQAKALAPEGNTEAYVGIGNVYREMEMFDEAQEMYEQSYKAYGRAVQLDGKNVRLRNDLALIAIYHLNRDWDQVKALLDSAIADGERILRDSPPDDADEQQRLEEAVGDSYENLALWHLKHSKDGTAAKAAATKSQDYYPGKRRPGARRHLRSAEQLLQGK